MFRISKKKSVQMPHIQQPKEQFDMFIENSQIQFEKTMESQEKASSLMTETLSFMISLGMSQQNPTQHEQSKKKLISCLLAVQEDEILKQNAEVQKLVNDIYRDMNDKDAMMNILSRLGTL